MFDMVEKKNLRPVYILTYSKMNFYTVAAKLNRAIDKRVQTIAPIWENPTEEQLSNARDLATRLEMNDFERNTRLGIRLMKRFKEIAHEEGLYTEKLKQTYFITIRPNPRDVRFNDFYQKIAAFIERKCFLKFELAFEQKGVSDETLGDGFHCHIIANLTQRSKGEVLRDVCSTFKDMASANCIQVDILKTPDDLKRCESYIHDHHSEDGHKITTKEWDEKWREREGLSPIYNTSLPTIKSKLAGSSPFRIEFL